MHEDGDVKQWTYSFDRGSLTTAILAIAVGVALAGGAIGGLVYSQTQTPQFNPVSKPVLVAFGSDDVEVGEYYVPFRMAQSERPPANAICAPVKPKDKFRTCFSPSGVAADREVSEADAAAIADATAERLRGELDGDVQTNDVTINNVVGAADDQSDGLSQTWTWVFGISGVIGVLIAIVGVAWAFWTGRAHLPALTERLRRGADSRAPSAQVRNAEAPGPNDQV